MAARADRRALIVGGGIGGLAAAIALRRVGIEAAVYERARSLAQIQVGGSYVLWFTGTLALKQLGLLDDVLAAGGRLETFEFRTARGRLLTRTRVGDQGRRLGAPPLSVMRADLHRLLAEALPEGAIRLGEQCVGFAQDAAGVTARFADGREERADLLIGADGINSVVCRQLHGLPPARYPGYGHWYGIIDFDDAMAPIGTFRILHGGGARFAFFHLRPGRLSWWCTVNGPEAARDTEVDRKRRLLAQFRGWYPPVEAILAATPEAEIRRRDTVDRPLMKRWGEGRVTLLGDAAHLMTFNLGQGAGSALKDAAMLGKYLGAEGDIATALRRYEARRIPRTALFTRASRYLGALSSWQSPLGLALQERFLRAAQLFMPRTLETDTDFRL